MNGPSFMYTSRPLVNVCDNIELPSCMYAMRNIQKNVINTNEKLAPVVVPKRAENRLQDVLEQVNKFLKKPMSGMKELEVRQEVILQQLAQLKQQVSILKSNLGKQKQPASKAPKAHQNTGQNKSILESALFEYDIVINAHPKYPPFFLLALRNLWKGILNINLSWHTHSNIGEASNDVKNLITNEWNTTEDEKLPLVKISVVWKNVGIDAQMVVSPLSRTAIRGDVNILRYLSRFGPSQLNYVAGGDAVAAAKVDALLDTCHCMVWSRTVKERQAFTKTLNASLGKSQYLAGDGITIADISAWSVLKQLSDSSQLPVNLAKWFQHCSDTFSNVN